MGGRALVIAVPFSYLRPDTILPRYRTLGYAVINDPAAIDGEVEPLLTDDGMEMRVFGNLTLGFYTGQAPSHSSVLKYNLPYSSDQPLSQDLWNWASQQGVSDAIRPTPTQVLDLIKSLNIPLKFGRPVLKDVLTRVLGKVKTLRPRLAGTAPTGGMSYASLVQAVVVRLDSTGAFRAALDAFVGGLPTSATVPATTAPPQQVVPASPTSPPPRAVPASPRRVTFATPTRRATAGLHGIVTPVTPAATSRRSEEVGHNPTTPAAPSKTPRPEPVTTIAVPPSTSDPSLPAVASSDPALQAVATTARSELHSHATNTHQKFSILHDWKVDVDKFAQLATAEVGELRTAYLRLSQHVDRLTGEYLKLQKQYVHASGPVAVDLKGEMNARFAQLEKCLKMVAFVVQSRLPAEGTSV